MKINSIHLTHFRNYDFLQLQFLKNIQIFVGDNGQGKTNLLESIYFLSTNRSFRIKEEKDMIQERFDLARIESIITRDDFKMRLSAILHHQGKSLFVNKQPIKKTSEFVGRCNAVLFSPADMDFFEASPRIRRRFIDIECSKISSRYMEHLSQYARLLKERNSHLKYNLIDDVYLDVVTDSLIQSALFIQDKRQEFTDNLQTKVSRYYSNFVDQKVDISMEYQSNLQDARNFDDMKAKFTASLSRDKTFKMTHLGIHRDDLLFSMDSRLVTNYASQGQKRMVILSTKLALIDYIYENSQTYPILLLDDVFSELDAGKKKKFSEILPKSIQIMITTTDMNEISGWPTEECEIFSVVEGKIKPFEEVM